MFFFFQAEDGIRDVAVTGVQTCALPISTVTATARADDIMAPSRDDRCQPKEQVPFRAVGGRWGRVLARRVWDRTQRCGARASADRQVSTSLRLNGAGLETHDTFRHTDGHSERWRGCKSLRQKNGVPSLSLT